MSATPLQGKPFHWNCVEAVECDLNDSGVHLFWIRSGTAVLKRLEHSEELRPHHLLCVNDRRIDMQVQVMEPLSGFHLQIESDFIATVFQEPLSPSFKDFLHQLAGPGLFLHFSQPGRSEAEWLLRRLLREDQRCADVFWTSIRLLLGQLLLLCYREWASMKTADERISSTGESVVRVLRGYIDEHCDKNLTLKQLAQRAGYAPSYLSCLFSKVNGQGLSEYISRKRITRAQEWLKSSDLKVVEICYRVGFRDLAHFNRTFKRFVGIPPSQYREEDRFVDPESHFQMARSVRAGPATSHEADHETKANTLLHRSSACS